MAKQKSILSKFFTVLCFSLLLLLNLVPFQAKASGLCRSVLHTVETDRSGAQLLVDRDSRLHTSTFVERVSRQAQRLGQTNLTRPLDKVHNWLNHLSNIALRAASSSFALTQIKNAMYNQYVIKPTEVPESYYALQIRIARERGHGVVSLSPEQRAELAKNLIQDQKNSLDRWTEYLVSTDSQMYPMWLKYWMYTGMTRLSIYNPETGSFGSRSKATVAPFVELNREALAYVADAVMKKVDKQSLDEITDPVFSTLLDDLNFGKLYGQTLLNMGVGQEGQFKTNAGRWVVYTQGSDHMALVTSLQGKGTGWCTAGESTAEAQLKDGDFHVFYSFDEQGQATTPRVAIRMEGDAIAEVRGVGRNQNLDPQISNTDTLATKMEEFGTRGRLYERKDRDAKMLTQIEKKHESGQELSFEELKFLYEIDQQITGFGYFEDPRIYQIKSARDLKSDLVVIFEYRYQRHEISTTNQEALSGNAKIHFGDLNLQHITSAAGLWLPDMITGSLTLNRLISAPGLKLPDYVGGSLYLDLLESAEGLKLPDFVRGSIDLGHLKLPVGLKFPDVIGGSLKLDNLKSAEGVKLPETIRGDLYLSSLTSAAGLKLPKTIGGDLYLYSFRSSGARITSQTAIGGKLYTR